LNPKFFRNGIVMLVLVVGTAALLFTWIQSSSTPNAIGYSQFLNDVQQNKVKGVVMLHYYAFESPFIVHLIMPVAVLVAVLITFGILGRHNEITAMKAGGVSVYRAALPALALGLLAAVFMFAVAEFVLPPMNRWPTAT